ncbi:ABC transporter permease [Desertimonas flava]|uniref:ABC transporter permease n=1 Tax=Desertimonas flava TaxID=2064846 RepID=UPI0019695256|nr:ABC transporter permease [Desertimonas flava]
MVVAVGTVPPLARRSGPQEPLAVDAALLVAGLAGFVVGCYSWLGVAGGGRVGVTVVSLAVTGVAAWRLLRHRWSGQQLGLWLSLGWLSLVAGAAIFADVLPLREAREPSKTLADPILLRPDLLSSHPLGTDRAALDMLGGVVYGARVSLTVGFGAVALGLVIGVPIGIAAGYFRRRYETAIDFVTNVMLAFPPVILLLAMVSIVSPSMFNLAVALGVLMVPIYVRIAKLNTLTCAERDFVRAAEVIGATRRRILAHEIFPCVVPPVGAYAVVVLASAIVAEASLSYLGLGIQRPEPTWGNMIAAGQDSFRDNPHLVFVPGTALVATVLALNTLSNVLRRRTDTRETSR